MINPWLVYPKPNPQANLRLFCFPFAGASASFFKPWADQLLPQIEVCAVQLPGRENRIKELLFTQLVPLLQEMIPALLPEFDRPFALFGHSLGALICFELVRQLRRLKHRQPFHLFISARQAPNSPDLHPPIHQLPEAEFFQQVCRFNGTPSVILQNARLMKLFLSILRADLAIAETYSYIEEAPLDCPISVFGGLQDEVVLTASLDGWREQTSSKFQLHTFSGNHFFLKSNQQEILQVISQTLL
ncbi:MAG: thioesterase domain-containing protein [Nostoc sp. ChiSLP02]|nr:thioesterase domain-containing protein [Nostoc sp. DedSLP05]MDZ8102837.1 thioesterase domain-containing protein [Nostoc sp. DedSLP01]MDZ8184152.1 thioesterase domain-containing protein [Nostoc sp. ChiSLP02]